jgi:hypothetical protein
MTFTTPPICDRSSPKWGPDRNYCQALPDNDKSLKKFIFSENIDNIVLSLREYLSTNIRQYQWNLLEVGNATPAS